MECNKEEAIRAKEIAERKMQSGDFLGANRIAQKAKQLDPDVQNISQLLLVCEVHISAKNKVNGSEMDWYRILQVDQFSDEGVIKKQYRKLALSLHPDKNSFPGAEAAFKLIGEANRVLTDPTKRSLYDMKFRGLLKSLAPKQVPHQATRNCHAKKQHGPANKHSGVHHSHPTNSHPYHQSQRPTFWTCCPCCNIRFQYYREYINKILRCQGCQHPFVAHDVGIHGVPTEPPRRQLYSQKGVPGQGPSKVVPQSTGVKPSADIFERLDPMAKTGTAADFVSKPEESRAGTAVETGSGFQQQEKVNGHVDVGVEADKRDTSIPNAKKSVESKTSEGANRKRSRAPVEESSKRFDGGSHTDNEENEVTLENSRISEERRRSSRKKQHVSYNENLNDAGCFVRSPTKISRGNKPPGVVDEKKEANIDGRVPMEDPSAGSVAANTGSVDLNKSEVKPRMNLASEESPLRKRLRRKSKTGDCITGGEEASMKEKADAKSENNVPKPELDPETKLCTGPEIFCCPDADFHNFNDLTESSFAVNQTWAIYDPADGMPRFYAHVKKVFTPGFKVKITWLEANSDDKDEQKWSEENLPVSCGKFENGDTIETEDIGIFSHQIHCRGYGKRTYVIYPKKGETWALFKDWDKKWSSKPDEHRPPYQYEFVEILSDFDENYGIGVAYLRKVKGFVSIFQHAACGGVISFCIKPGELYRFSHNIPSVKMTGKEGEGVPVGSFEFDPAALPANLDQLGDLIDVGVERENLDASAEKQLKPANSSEKICTPKKHESSPRKDGEDLHMWSDLDPPLPYKLDGQSVERESLRTEAAGLHSTSFKVGSNFMKGSESEKPCTPRKQGTVSEKWTSKPGQSEGGSNGTRKNENPVDACQFVNMQDNRKVVTHGNCTEVDKSIKAPKRQAREIAPDASKPRRSPRDLSKENSISNSSQFTSAEDSKKNISSKSGIICGISIRFSHHSNDQLRSPMKDEGTAGITSSTVASRCRVVEVDPYDFKKEKAQDKFEVGQIWSAYSDRDGLPRSYGLVRKIQSAPDFRLHVAMLEACSGTKDSRQCACCGTYKVKNCKTRLLSPLMFSHRMNAKLIEKNKYEIRPRKGEIWAIYKNWNSESTVSDESIEECDFVEVLEDDEETVKVIVLKRINGSESFYRAPRIQRSKSGVMNFRCDELGRFSHQCSAYLHKGEKDSRLKGFWELDPRSVPGTVILLD